MSERTGKNDRGRRRILVAVTVAVVVSVGIAVGVVLAVRGPSAVPGGKGDDAMRWRWESYRGIELRVPDRWENSSGAIGAGWCAANSTAERAALGTVVRPGLVLTIGCSSPYPPVEQRRPAVGFDSVRAVGIQHLDGGWVVQTRRMGGVFVTVFADDAQLRSRIFDSAHVVTGEDHYGCPPDHPASAGRDYRPRPAPGGLPDLGDVESISLCRYLRGDAGVDHDHGAGAAILSASRVTGTAARHILDAITSAPLGEGPNDPGNCLPEVAYGEELMILRIHTHRRTAEVLVRYHGCDGHHVDDGTTVRRLTGDLLRSVLTGPHTPSTLSGPVVRLLGHR